MRGTKGANGEFLGQIRRKNRTDHLDGLRSHEEAKFLGTKGPPICTGHTGNVAGLGGEGSDINARYATCGHPEGERCERSVRAVVCFEQILQGSKEIR